MLIRINSYENTWRHVPPGPTTMSPQTRIMAIYQLEPYNTARFVGGVFAPKWHTIKKRHTFSSPSLKAESPAILESPLRCRNPPGAAGPGILEIYHLDIWTPPKIESTNKKRWWTDLTDLVVFETAPLGSAWFKLSKVQVGMLSDTCFSMTWR